MAPPSPVKPAVVEIEQGQGQVAPPRAVAAGSPLVFLNYVLRFLAVALTLTAAAVMGSGKETQSVVFDASSDPLNVTLKAISQSAFKYFVAANTIACAYSIVSLLLSIVSRGSPKNVRTVVTLLDVVMVGLLFSANGAAAAITNVARKGEEGLWPKLCDVWGKVCDHMTASIVLSMIAALAFLLLVMFSVLGSHSRSP